MTRKTAPRNRQPKQTAWTIWFSLLVGFLAQLTFKLDLSVAVAVLLYLVAAILFVRSVGEIEFDVANFNAASLSLVPGKFATVFRNHGFEWLLVIVLILIASFF